MVNCVRVDGASDEGPSHDEVQYYWTQYHVRNSKYTTIVTTRAGGSSYLNHVELQNGCLALGHSNTIIPSTITGLNVDSDTGEMKKKLHENLSQPIDVYVRPLQFDY